MISSPNTGGFVPQIEAIRQRLVSIRDRLLAQSNRMVSPEIDGELESAIEVLQTAQTVIRQAEESPEIERLRALLREKDIILREIHHRIKNNLQIVTSLLDLQVMRTQDTSIQALLRSNQSRIRSIALVHERLSQSSNATTINLSEYTQSLTETLVQIYAIDPRQVRLRAEVSGDIELSSNQVVPVGLILNELTSNALRHGLVDQPGEIIVRLQVISSQVSLTVSDTGNRFPADLDLNAPRTLGFQIANALVQQINGRLIREPSTEQTALTIQFDAADLE